MPSAASFARPAMITGAALVGANYYTNKVTAHYLKKQIEARDRDVIGTDIFIQKCDVNLLQGQVKLRNVNVVNPEQQVNVKFQNPDLLRIGEIVFDLGMISLITKKMVEIEEFSLKDVEIIIEMEDVWGPDVLFGKSNVAVMLDNIKELRASKQLQQQSKQQMQNTQQSQVQGEGGATAKVKVQLAENGNDSNSNSDVHENKNNQQEKKQKGSKKIVLRKVELKNIGADIHGQAQLKLADINYDDFSEEVGASMLDDIVVVIMKTLLETAKANAMNIDYKSLAENSYSGKVYSRVSSGVNEFREAHKDEIEDLQHQVGDGLKGGLKQVSSLGGMGFQKLKGTLEEKIHSGGEVTSAAGGKFKQSDSEKSNDLF